MRFALLHRKTATRTGRPPRDAAVKPRRVALATMCLLLLPLAAMRFTGEVAWEATDFLVAGILLMGTGLAYELLVRKASSRKHRAAIGAVLLAALLLVWVNLANGA